MRQVKEIRKLVGMKQYVLASILGIEQSNYANMENGKLHTNYIPMLRDKALSILKPQLQVLIEEKERELKNLNNLLKI